MYTIWYTETLVHIIIIVTRRAILYEQFGVSVIFSRNYSYIYHYFDDPYNPEEEAICIAMWTGFDDVDKNLAL